MIVNLRNVIKLKRVIFLVLSVLLFISFCGCKGEETESRADVIINMPEDNSVNGYRVSAPQNSSITSSSNENKAEPTETKYCVNINSKVFHKISCSSVSTMKEENKAFFLNRDLLIDEGYTPCKRCNP